MCEGTSSIYTEKLLTCLACLAKLWTTQLPKLQIWENWQKLKEAVQTLISLIRWPYEDKDSSSLQRDLWWQSQNHLQKQLKRDRVIVQSLQLLQQLWPPPRQQIEEEESVRTLMLRPSLVNLAPQHQHLLYRDH